MSKRLEVRFTQQHSRGTHPFAFEVLILVKLPDSIRKFMEITRPTLRVGAGCSPFSNTQPAKLQGEDASR